MERHRPPTLRETEMSASGVCVWGGGGGADLRIWPTRNVNEVVIFLEKDFLRKGLIYPINMHFKCAYFVQG